MKINLYSKFDRILLYLKTFIFEYLKYTDRYFIQLILTIKLIKLLFMMKLCFAYNFKYKKMADLSCFIIFILLNS